MRHMNNQKKRAQRILLHGLSLDAEGPVQFILTKIKDKAAQDALVGLASSVKAGGAPDLALAARFVYMSMHRNQGLQFLYHFAHTCAANRHAQNIAHGDFRAHSLVEFRGGI